MAPNPSSSKIPAAFTSNNNYYGVPFRGKTYPFKQSDPEQLKPQYKVEIHIKQFNLSNADDLAEYVAVFQQVANQTAFISFEEKLYDPEIHSWRVLLRWGDSYYEAPNADVLEQRIIQ